MRTLLSTLAAIAVLLPSVSQAQMYKCVDERGRVQFRDVPCKGKVVSGPAARAPVLPAASSADRSREANARKKEVARERAAASDLSQRCAAMQEERLRLANDGARPVFNAAGERVFMDKKRAERFAALTKQLRGCT
jgi:hypothetical protein